MNTLSGSLALPPTPTVLTPEDVQNLDQLFAAGLDGGASFVLPSLRRKLLGFSDDDGADAAL
jgi:hypothetical protein